MKKIQVLAVLIGMCVFAGPSMAQGIESGQSVVDFYLGAGSALQKSGMEVDGQNLSWGKVGADAGISYLYFSSPYLGIGADIHYAGFQGSESFEDVPGRWHWHTFDTDFEMSTLHVMGIGRINLNPDSPVRIYLPFGAGIALSKGSMKYIWDNYEIYQAENYDSSFSWYAGIGVEFETNNGFAWGIEARYNAFEHNYKDLSYLVGGHIVDTNPERNYISLVLKAQF